jgi:hypothetical protein
VAVAIYVVLNVITASVFVAIFISVWRRRRQGIGPTLAGWVAILVNVVILGVYLPVGPVAWWLRHRNDEPVLENDASGQPT